MRQSSTEIHRKRHSDRTGRGSTIAHLIRFIQEEQLDIKVVTPSWETKRKCEGAGLAVIPLSEASAVDVAFDGCDQVDAHLHALKSGGGIHTDEKLVASMANEYILLADESKVVKELTYEHPVLLEVIPQALGFVMNQLSDAEKVEIRMSSDKDGPVMTDRGNLLLDVYVKGSQDSVKTGRTVEKTGRSARCLPVHIRRDKGSGGE